MHDYILCCKSLLPIQTEMLYKIVDILDVEESVRFFNQDDDEIVESLLGSMNHTMETINADVCSLLLCHIADYMYKLYQVFNNDLYSTIFDLK